MCSFARSWSYNLVRCMQCFKIVALQATAHNYHRIVMLSQNIIDKQPCNTSVSVLKRVNPYIAIMEQCRQFNGREFTFLLCFVVPIHQIGHQCRRLFRRSILKAVAITRNNRVRARLVLSGMNSITCLNSTRQVTIDSIIFSQ